MNETRTNMKNELTINIISHPEAITLVDQKHRTVAHVPWRGNRDSTLRLAKKLVNDYRKNGFIFGPAPMKVHMSVSGYKYLFYNPHIGHVPKDVRTGEQSAWGAVLNHANPGIIWRNTHLEFAAPL